MSSQLIAMPVGARLETRAIGRALIYDLSGTVTVNDMLTGLASAWVLQSHRRLSAAVVDATEVRSPDRADNARATGRQIRYILRGIPRVPVAVVLRTDTLEAGRFAAYEMALDGRLMGVFTELTEAQAWIAKQIRLMEEQARWRTGAPGQRAHEPSHGLLGRLSRQEIALRPPPSGSNPADTDLAPLQN